MLHNKEVINGNDNPHYVNRRGNRTERLNKVFVSQDVLNTLLAFDLKAATPSPSFIASIVLEELYAQGKLEETIKSYRRRIGTSNK